MTTAVAQLHRIPDVQARLGIGRTTMFELLRAGEIKSVKIGRRRLIPESALVAYVEKLTAAV